MLLLGNIKTNEVFEAKLIDHKSEKPVHPGSSRAEKDQFIRDKYVRRKYVAEVESDEVKDMDKVWYSQFKHGLLLSQCINFGK
jgi:Arf-GAP/coiled-coil/ANK repeat/PH domain-containing protein